MYLVVLIIVLILLFFHHAHTIHTCTDYIDESRSPFTDELFRLIDIDASGYVDFNEYVQMLSTYCMYSKDDILKCTSHHQEIDHDSVPLIMYIFSNTTNENFFPLFFI